MPVYVSMLRGINVSGKNRISMPDLRAVYERHGHDHVTTYAQSGNVVSRTSARSASAVERAVTSAIAAELGLDITVLVRTPAHLANVLDANPFVRAGIDTKFLYLTFLAAAPEHRAVSDLDGAAFAPDEFRMHGTEVYLKCPNGYGRTKINNTWFERKLAVAATTRNWKTVTQLAELARI